MIEIKRGNYNKQVCFAIPLTEITSLIKLAGREIKEVLNEEIDFITGNTPKSMNSYLRDLAFVLLMFNLINYEYKL